ncbi:MAG: hypothetical protein AMXMBFR84_51050 [Candidatus Hydrogenedentota bacterium]
MAKAKAQSRRFDSVGWIFLGISFVVLLGPCIYWAWGIVLASTHFITRIGLGIVLAMLASAFVTFGTNTVLQYAAKKRDAANRKQGKKKSS